MAENVRLSLWLKFALREPATPELTGEKGAFTSVCLWAAAMPGGPLFS